jgi:dynein heavy chain
VLSIQPREVGGAGGMTPDEIVLEKSKELLDKLPAVLEKAEGNKDLFVAMNAQGIIASLSTVLLQEMEKFNRLLNKMKRSLTDIDLAIKGFIVMGDELDKMYLRI